MLSWASSPCPSSTPRPLPTAPSRDPHRIHQGQLLGHVVYTEVQELRTFPHESFHLFQAAYRGVWTGYLGNPWMS